MVEVRDTTGDRAKDADESEPIRLSTVPPALALAMMQAGGAVSLAALLFTGEASGGLARAATTFVIGSVIASVVCSLKGSFSVVIASAKTNVTVVLASVSAAVLADGGGGAENTTVVFVMVATVASGVLLYLVGRFERGGLVRYLPFPVLGGYLAGTAWLMVRGGLEVMTRGRFPDLTGADVLSWDTAKYVLPGLALVLAFAVLRGATQQSLAIVTALVGFHLLLSMTNSHDTAEDDGWVLGPLPPSSGVSALLPSFDDVAWTAIASQFFGILAVALIALIGLLLNTTGVGYAIDEDYDVNQELRAAGAASIASGLAGGTVGFIGPGQTLLAHRFRTPSALVSACFALLALITVAAGPELIGWMPRFVAGALIISPAFLLVRRWWSESIRVGSLGDRIVAVAIPIVIALFGVLEGVAVGIVAAAAIFVVRYSSIDPVRSQLSGATMRSAIERAPQERRILASEGDGIVVMEVVGYLFFGSVARLTDRVRELISNGVEHCILDLRRVPGVDSSAEAELAKLRRDCAAADVTLYIAEAEAALLGSGSLAGAGHLLHPTVDVALEIAEAAVLANNDSDHTGVAFPDVITRHFRRFVVDEGEDLVRVGAPSSSMFIVESGHCTVWHHQTDGPLRRVRRILPGSVVGEMGFFSGAERSATVTADSELVVLGLTRDRFELLAREQPDAAMSLVLGVLDLSSQRLREATGTIRDLQR